MKFCRRQQTKWSFLGALYLSMLTSLALAQSPDPQVVKEREVLLTVSVTNRRGLPINGLKPEHFNVASDKKPLVITTFSDRDEPVSIAFLIDTSGSMATAESYNNKLRRVLRGVQGFLQNSNAANEYSILSFNTEARLVLDWTQDIDAVTGAMTKLALQPAKGLTAFYDACRQGMDLTQRGSHHRKIIILLSDGDDTASKDPRFRKLKEAVRANDAVFYTINIVSLGMGPENADGENAVENLAQQTGGRTFLPLSSFDIEAAFELLALMLRNQYLIGFKPSQAATDGKWHEVKIEIKLPLNAPGELKYPVVKYRPGYFGPAARD